MQEIARSNRRRDRRAKPRPSVRAICRKGALDLGANVSVCVLDISEAGVRLIVSESLDVSQEVTVTFTSAANLRSVRRLATVTWCVAAPNQTWLVGMQFDKRMPYSEWQRLT